MRQLQNSANQNKREQEMRRCVAGSATNINGVISIVNPQCAYAPRVSIVVLCVCVCVCACVRVCVCARVRVCVCSVHRVTY